MELNGKTVRYSKSRYLLSIRWQMEEIPRAKTSQKRATHHKRATPASDTKFGVQRKPANKRLPITNEKTGAIDIRPILGNRPSKSAGTQTTGNINAASTTRLHPNGGGGNRVRH